MKTYELTYIISPEITSEEAEAKAKEIESIIQGKEGTILNKSNPTAKTLSYPIKKRASGFLGSLEFQLEPEKLLELEEIIAKDGNIARHMVIIKEPLMAKKERRTREASRTKSVPAFEAEKKTEVEQTKTETPVREAKEKVELKDIEQKLDELLGE
jgi:small subunit ribosomal protein S6